MSVLRLTLFYVLTCLLQHAHGSEIIHGKKAPKKLMQYMASVQDSRDQHVCGGFLISEDFVLTAAHCDQGNPTSVVLGTHNLKEAKMRYKVTRCKNPDFKGAKFGDDIMLLKLSQKVKLIQKLQPVRLPEKAAMVKDNEKCLVAGGGSTKTGGKTVDQLQVAEVPVVNLKKCQRIWKQIDLPHNVICAGGYNITKGFCKGDSGGPLVCGGLAVGVVSFNMRNNCDHPNMPNVYTDVSKYLGWIKRIRKQTGC